MTSQPNCPTHGARMLLASGPYGGFAYCPHWPDCSFKAKPTENGWIVTDGLERSKRRKEGQRKYFSQVQRDAELNDFVKRV